MGRFDAKAPFSGAGAVGCVAQISLNVWQCVAVRRRFRAKVGVFWQTLVSKYIRNHESRLYRDQATHIPEVDDLRKELTILQEETLGHPIWSQKRQMTRGWLSILYSVVRDGDLVLVPSPLRTVRDANGKLIHSYTMIGKVTSPPMRFVARADSLISAAKFLVRRVEWLPDVDERDLPYSIIKLLRTSNALISLRASTLYRAIGTAYNNSIIGNQHFARFTTSSATFTTDQNLNFSAFAMATVVAHKLTKSRELSNMSARSVYDIAATASEWTDLVLTQDAMIHSPGYTTLQHTTLIVIFVAALYSLASHPDASKMTPKELQEVTITNSEPSSEELCPPLQRAMHRMMEVFPNDLWIKYCQVAKASREGAGLSPSVEVRANDGGTEE